MFPFRFDRPALPVSRNSRAPHELPGHHASFLEDYENPHEAIDHLRQVECGKVPSVWGRAPFSDDVLHTPETWSACAMRQPPRDPHVVSAQHPGLVHIPILSIVGICNFGNLDNAEAIATFGDALFQGLHGASLLFPHSLDYLCSDSVKGDLHPLFEEMPEKHGISKVNSKYKAKRGLDFSKCGSGYIANNGKQRTLLAMYAIWQREGRRGMLRNVSLSIAPA